MNNSPIKILWRNGNPVFTFHGHNMDGTEEFKNHEIRKKRQAILRNREWFHHHSVGLRRLTEEIEECIKDGKETDYHYNGEDEYPVDTFNTLSAAKSVVHFLKNRGLIKSLI
jgi:hypothetical protein